MHIKSILLFAALVPTVMLGCDNVTKCYIFKPNVYDVASEKCLATAIYGEAQGEPAIGKVAVAYTVLNRAVKKPVCAVVLAPKQYSIFNNNPALRAAAMDLNLDPKQRNIVETWAWQESVKIAQMVMRKEIPDPTFGSTHYLAPNLMKRLKYKFPKWSRQYEVTVVINNHTFYKMQ